MESQRVDRYIWAVRLYRSRAEATAACRAGHVKVNGAMVKPAHAVRVGDRVMVTRQRDTRDLEVTELLSTRVGASTATTCYIDHSPPRPALQQDGAPFQRDAASGRPTKKDRRQLDRLRGS